MIRHLTIPVLFAGLFSLAFPSASSRASFADQLDETFVSVHTQVASSVVVVSVQRDPKRVSDLPREIEQVLQSDDELLVPPEQGSGFIIDGQGHILTNKHVIDNALPGGIRVRLVDKREFTATLLGTDPDNDIAVLKADIPPLPAATIGNSDTVRVGQIVFAIGTPYHLQDTFTIGVISATGRSNLPDSAPGSNYLQTDAAIHPGNSGGPLCDIHGRIIGVNSLVNGINRGLGFAVPINRAMASARQIIESGDIHRPSLSMEATSISEDPANLKYFAPITDGVVVLGLQPNSQEYSAGLRPADVIISSDDGPVKTPGDIQHSITSRKVGQTVHFNVIRAGKNETVALVLPEYHSTNSANSALPPSVEPRSKPILGINFSKGRTFLTVESIAPYSLAEQANIQPGDIVISVNGASVRTGNEFLSLASSSDPKRGTLIQIERGHRRGFVILDSTSKH